MTLVQYAPFGIRQAKGVLQALENKIAALRAIAVPSQGRERKRMVGSVSQRKLAVLRQPVNTGIPELGVSSPEHALEFPGSGPLCFEPSDLDQIVACFHAVVPGSVSEGELAAGLFHDPGDETLVIADALLELGRGV